MVKLNRVWWQHLAPKSMHRRLGEVEKLISNWCTTAYGQHWLKSARHPGHMLRLLPGDHIPVVHLVALGNRPIFIAPQGSLKIGHRFVGSDQFESGRPLVENEIPILPWIRLDVVTDEALIKGALKMQLTGHVHGVKSPSTLFSIPAHYLLAPKQWPDKAYALYQHIFGMGNSYPDDGYFYVGITKRRWQTRWAEHMRAVESGSNLAFHRKFREERAAGQITYVHHKLMGITDDLEALYNSEKYLIEGHWDDLRRLNMIPGGKAGLRYLREHSIVSKGEVVSPDEREGVLSEWLSRHRGKTLPIMSLSERWQDQAWAEAQICSRSDRLSVSQVAAIREMAAHFQLDEIAERTGATHQQIVNVISGKAYARVR